MLKPPLFRRFVAQWLLPAFQLAHVFGLTCASWFVSSSWRAAAVFQLTLADVAIASGAAVVGYFTSLLTGPLLLGPFLRRQAQSNGAPFSVGDRVVLLAGKHAGTVTEIYAEWQHGRLRVALGASAKDNYADIFSEYQLLRV